MLKSEAIQTMKEVNAFVNKFDDPIMFITALLMASEEGCYKFDLDIKELMRSMTFSVHVVNDVLGPYDPNNDID